MKFSHGGRSRGSSVVVGKRRAHDLDEVLVFDGAAGRDFGLPEHPVHCEGEKTLDVRGHKSEVTNRRLGTVEVYRSLCLRSGQSRRLVVIRQSLGQGPCVKGQRSEFTHRSGGVAWSGQVGRGQGSGSRSEV